MGSMGALLNDPAVTFIWTTMRCGLMPRSYYAPIMAARLPHSHEIFQAHILPSSHDIVVPNGRRDRSVFALFTTAGCCLERVHGIVVML